MLASDRSLPPNQIERCHQSHTISEDILDLSARNKAGERVGVPEMTPSSFTHSRIVTGLPLADNRLKPSSRPIHAILDGSATYTTSRRADIFVVAALAGRTKYIVSGDKALLRLRRFHEVSIVTARGFLHFLDKPQDDSPEQLVRLQTRSGPALTRLYSAARRYGMLDHLSLGTTDLARAIAFYDAALAPLGGVRVWTCEDAVGYGYPGENDRLAIKRRPGFVTPAAGSHVALVARSRSEVDAFFQAAVAHGGTDDGAPDLRPHYGPTYYAAFVLDPDGHRLEAVCHSA